MTQIWLYLYMVLLPPAQELSAAIAPVRSAQRLSEEDRLEYSLFIVMAGREVGVDPYLIAAVMWHESGFRAELTSRTKDYGLMQVHWQRLHPQHGETWLNGLTPDRLLDPFTNIVAGARELAHKRRGCRRRGHDPTDHAWWGHYKWGNVVKSHGYEQAVQKKRETLLRYRGKIRKQHRSRGASSTS